MSQQTITAMFDSREHANTAALMLRQAGIRDSDVVVSPEIDTLSADLDTDRPATGFWASLEKMFGGTDDHQTYREGLRRGGTMITAHVDDDKVDDVVSILEEHGSVDMNERETAWRGEGWNGAGATTATTPQAPIAGGYVPTAASTTSAPQGRRDDVVQVAEEQLNVGKRAVNRGKVRLHTYVVETAVSENVTLRDETVSIERRPVDRAIGTAHLSADPFQERTIEMDEIDEEAVVGKSTRVVEEIGIRKDVTDRVETINDTVRSTKVDIEDSRTGGMAASGTTSLTGKLAKDMAVVGSDRQHVGIIDHVDGDTIKLKRNDPASGGQHHLIPAAWVGSVGSEVILKTTAATAKAGWTAA